MNRRVARVSRRLIFRIIARDDVDADSKDSDGQTPLSWAAHNGHEAVVKLFRAQDDVDINSKDLNDQL